MNSGKQDKFFHLPDLGEGLLEAEIVSWTVAEGDHVVADQPLLSVETDKAVVEIPSPRSGRVAQLMVKVGDQVEVGAPLVKFEEGAAADSGAIVGTVEAKEDKAASEETAVGSDKAVARMKAPPAVRALARKLAVDLTLVAPTGPNDTITKADVERAAQTLADAGPLERLRGVRRAMMRNMTLSGAEVVPATVTEEADIEAWPEGSDVTVQLVQALAAGCRAEPSLNAWYDADNMGRRLHETVDVGIAMDTGDGLFVPVLRDAANRTAMELRVGLDRMMADVQQRTVPPEELRGQTITLSNFGMIGGLHAHLVVVPPQVAIVGAGRIVQRVVWHDDKPMPHRVIPLSLTFDHRVVNGGEAARFLSAVKIHLENFT